MVFESGVETGVLERERGGAYDSSRKATRALFVSARCTIDRDHIGDDVQGAQWHSLAVALEPSPTTCETFSRLFERILRAWSREQPRVSLERLLDDLSRERVVFQHVRCACLEFAFQDALWKK